MASEQQNSAAVDDVVVVHWDGKGIWRFWCAASLLVAINVAALLEGFCFLTVHQRILGYVGIAPLLLGGVVEQWLMIRRGQWYVSERLPLGPMSRLLSRAIMYIVPPIAASAGRVVPWEAWVGLGWSVALAVRYGVLWSRRPIAESQAPPAPSTNS